MNIFLNIKELFNGDTNQTTFVEKDRSFETGLATLSSEPHDATQKKIKNAKWLQSVNLLSAEFVGFISRIMIERAFFQNTQIPQELLLYMVNDVIEIVSPQKEATFSMSKEFSILWKQLRGESLTSEEEDYDKDLKEIDVLNEVLNGVKYSSMALLGQSVYSSLTSVQQELWGHVPYIVGYATTLLYGSKCLSLVVDKVLQQYEMDPEQKALLQPWLIMVGRLALGMIPKVHATEEGVHYHYPSLQGHIQTFSAGQTVTLQGEDLSVDREGKLETPDGDLPGTYLLRFKLGKVQELSEAKIRIQVVNEEGQTVPVEFIKKEGTYGPEIQVFCSDKKLERYWANYFVPKPLPSSASQNAFFETDLVSRNQDSLSCFLGLSAGVMGTLATRSLLPLSAGMLPCLKPVATDTQSSSSFTNKEYETSLAQMNFWGILEECEKRIKQGNPPSYIYYYYGVVLKKLGSYKEAYDSFSKAVDLGYSEARQEKTDLDRFIRGQRDIEFRNDFLKEIKQTVPTDYEYILMSDLVYKTKGELLKSEDWNDFLQNKGWERVDTSEELKITGNSYSGMAFVNTKTRQVVIAHRGVILTDGTSLKDLKEIALSGEPKAYEQAKKFTESVVQMNQGFKISHTGYSLGGAIAQLLAYYRTEYAVTVDSPGIKKIIENSKNQETLGDVHIISYLSLPNLINTHGTHIGELRTVSQGETSLSVMPTILGWGTQVLDSFWSSSTTTTTAITEGIGFVEHEWKSHAIEYIRKVFDPDFGYPKAFQRVNKWPSGINERVEFEDICKKHGINPAYPVIHDPEVNFKLRRLHDTNQSNPKRMPLSAFSNSVQKMLKNFYNEGKYYDNFNLHTLMLFDLQGDEVIVRSNPQIFSIEDFKSYVESQITLKDQPKEVIHHFNKCCDIEEQPIKQESEPSWREFAIFFGLNCIQTKFSDLEREKLKKFIQQGDKHTFKLHLGLVGGSRIEEEINEELRSSGIQISSTSNLCKSKIIDCHMDFTTLIDELFKNTYVKDQMFTTVMHNSENYFQGRNLLIKDSHHVELMQGEVTDFSRDCRGMHFTLKDNSTVTIELGLDCQIKGVSLRRHYQHSLLDYFKRDELSTEINLEIPKDARQLPEWIKPGRYRVQASEERAKQGEKVVYLTSSSDGYTYKVIMQNHGGQILAQMTKEGEDSSLDIFQFKSLIVGYFGSSTFLEVLHEKADKMIVVQDYIKNDKLEKFEKIQQLQDSLVVELREEKNEVYLDDCLNHMIDIRFQNFTNTTLLNGTGSHIKELEKRLKEISDLYKEIQDARSEVDIFKDILFETNYQKLVDKTDSLLVSKMMQLFTGAYELIKEIVDKDAILFFSMTGAGKSTCINFCLGNELVPVLTSYSQKIYKTKQNQTGNFPKIGHSLGVSETVYVRGFPLLDKKTVLVDAPGLGDTRGEDYELCAALSIDQAIQKARSIRVAIVVPYEAFLLDKGNPVTFLMETVQELIPTAFQASRRQDIFVLVSKHGDYTDNQFKEMLQKLCSSQANSQTTIQRKEIWKALCSMATDNQIGLIQIGNVRRRIELLEKFMDKSHTGIPSSDFFTLMQTDAMQAKFAANIEKAAASWTKEIIQRYLVTLPAAVENCRNIMTEASRVVNREEQSIKTNNEEIKNNLKNIKGLESKKNALEKQKDSMGKNIDPKLQKEIEEQSRGILEKQIDNLHERIEGTQNQVNYYAKEAEKYNDQIQEAQKEIDILNKNIIHINIEIEDYSTGTEHKVLYRFKKGLEDRCTHCFVKAGARDQAWLEKRETNEKDCVNGRYDHDVPCKDIEGAFVHDVEIERDYWLVPKDDQMRKEFIENGVAVQGSLIYRAILDGAYFELDKQRRVDANGRRIVYYFKTDWKRGREFPWLTITHELPKIHTYEARLTNLHKNRENLERDREYKKDQKSKAKEFYQKSKEAHDRENDTLKDLRIQEKDLKKTALAKGVDILIEQTQSLIDQIKEANTNLSDRNTASDGMIKNQNAIIVQKKSEIEKLGREKRKLAIVLRTREQVADVLEQFCELATSLVASKQEERRKKGDTMGEKSKLRQTCEEYQKAFKDNREKLVEQTKADLGF